jgi:hypothetical protein
MIEAAPLGCAISSRQWRLEKSLQPLILILNSKMSSSIRLLYHTGTITLAVIWAFVWLRTPSLNHYSVQLFGVVILAYFVIKKFNQADFWQLLPSPASLEMALATLAFLLIISYWQHSFSPVSLSFVHLFFLTLSAQNLTTLIILFEIILFHYSLSSGIGTIETSYLVSLPIVTGFFLLAKDQFLKVFKKKASVTQVTNISKTVETIRELQKVDQALENLLGNLLTPQAMKASPLAINQLEQTEPMIEQSPAQPVTDSIDEPVVNLAELEINSPPSQTSTNQAPLSKISPDLAELSERIADEILDEVSRSKT